MLQQKDFKLEVKAVEDDGTFSGYASVTGNNDSDNEVIDKGAFKRTLDHTKGVVPILWQHDRTQPVGWNVSASEDGHGLAVTGKLMVDTELGRYAQSFLKSGLAVGAKPGLSIGFTVPKDGQYIKEGVRHFKEIALKEYSIATFQSNPEAFVNVAKETATTKRVAGEDLSASAFAYVGDPEKTETWKLPIKFSTDAKTTSHIRNALARFSQTQGIPDSERAAVLAKIKHAAKEHGINVADDSKEQKDFSSELAEATAQSALQEERCNIENALYSSVQDVLADESLDDQAKESAIAENYAQYAIAMGEWYGKFIATDTDDDAAEDDDMKQQKAGAAISQATAAKLQAAMAHMKSAAESIKKGIGHLEDLSQRGETRHDVNLPNPVGGGKAEAEDEDKKEAEGASAEDHVPADLLEKFRSLESLFKA